MKTNKLFKRRFRHFSFGLSLLALSAIVFDIGIGHSPAVYKALLWLYFITLSVGTLSIVARYFGKERPRVKVWAFDTLLLFFMTGWFFSFFSDWSHSKYWFLAFFDHKEWTYVILFLFFIREFSDIRVNFSRDLFNPAQLFIISFLSLILAGALILMLPNASYRGISFIDALFTSTSAVCVTGLIVVDTGSFFTPLGQTILIILIQIGGLGIMTFTSYFSYFFRGGTTYENQLVLRDMSNSEKIAEVFSTLRKIILLTATIEVLGAVIIYSTLDREIITSEQDRIFFSVFHSISAFCNAGFSTLTNGLNEFGFRFNYPLQLIIALLFILGGLGFPIVFNFIKYIKHLLKNRLLPFSLKRKGIYIPWVININSRIVLITTAFLIVFGTFFFYIFEYNNTLTEHSGFGKLVTAFFGAVTPRTAGFNTVNMNALDFSTIMIIFFLMWVGASSASTGGGIKTSTLAIASLNFLSLARGKEKVEIFRREIAFLSIRRAFAIIALSLMVIGVAVFFIASFDSEKDLLHIAFECFSAYSTVGLSLGLTAELSNASKVVIMITMFLGRVGMLTVLVALFRKVNVSKYRYPTEEILIN